MDVEADSVLLLVLTICVSVLIGQRCLRGACGKEREGGEGGSPSEFRNRNFRFWFPLLTSQ